jgi:hypothetical protein
MGKDDQLILRLDSELNAAAGKDLVQLMLALIPVQPFALVLSLEKDLPVAIGVTGYLSEVKDTAKACGGKFSLADFHADKYPQNVQRVISTYFLSQ